MKLFYASGSPYARIARIAVREMGLQGEVSEEEVTLRDPNSALLPYNPGGKVPTLQLDDGTILTESLLLLSYLDTRHSGRNLLPTDGSDGWRTVSGLGRAYAFLDAITAWNRELRFGLEAPGVIALETARANRAADAFERAIGDGEYSGPFDAAQLVLGAALDNASRRHKVWQWRPSRPRLAAFSDAMNQRPSFASTLQPELEL